MLKGGSYGTKSSYFDVYQNYVIRSKKRNALVDHLRASGIEVLISWPTPNHKQRALGLDHYKLPVTEQTSCEVASLPIYPELTDGEAEIVINAVKAFFK